MALGATIHRFAIELSDVGRGVYASLDLRVARHPSESLRYMLARVLAYCLRYEEGIEMGRGVSTAEEPAVWVRDLRGEVTAWIEIGQPSTARLHKASKTGARVYVYAHEDPRALVRDLERNPVHRQDDLEIHVLPPPLLDALEERVGRNETWTLTVADGELYLTRNDETLQGRVERVPVA